MYLVHYVTDLVFFVCESVEKAKHNVVKADILHQILPEDLF